jgi:protein-S-isoprenylcysteine O-methyltransferase Ste14
MSALELKIPPVVVTLVLGMAMWVASSAVPSFALPFAVRAAVASALVAAGLCVVAAGVASFRQARTTINPTTPDSTSSLVVAGIYRVTRNPMYLGELLVLLGWAAFLSNALALAISAVFVLYVNRFQIAPEERALSAVFGADYAAYKARVRRWL